MFRVAPGRDLASATRNVRELRGLGRAKLFETRLCRGVDVASDHVATHGVVAVIAVVCDGIRQVFCSVRKAVPMQKCDDGAQGKVAIVPPPQGVGKANLHANQPP